MKIGSREYKEWLDSPLTKALKSSFEQSVTDPENQPSQYGTVTLAMYELVCKQRDLAVEAVPTFVAEFARFVGGDGEFWLHELEDFLDTWKKMQDSTIKGSEK